LRYPADQSPDIAYEAALIQRDTHTVLLPVVADALHPAITRLAELCRAKDVPWGTVQLLEMEQGASGEVLTDADVPGHKPSFPGWQVAAGGGRRDCRSVRLRYARKAWSPANPCLLAGRFERGGLLQASSCLISGSHAGGWQRWERTGGRSWCFL